jgi:hypothetical protein
MSQSVILDRVRAITGWFPDIWDEDVINAYGNAAARKVDFDGVRNAYLLRALFDWRKSKQVFRFTPELAELLDLDTELDDESSLRLFHMDYKVFYLQSDRFKTCDGFLYYMFAGNLSLIPLTDDPYERNSFFDMAPSEMTSPAKFVAKMRHPELTTSEASPDSVDDFELALKMLMYLSADNREVRKAPESSGHKPPKPGAKIRDVWKEVTVNEAGAEIAERVRTWKAASSSASSASPKDAPIRHVSPHMRRAHWHHYWTGPRDSDDRKLIVHWLPPTFVASDPDTELPMTTNVVDK